MNRYNLLKQELTDLLARLIAFYPVTSEQTNIKRLLEFCTEQFALNDTNIIENNGVFTLTASTQRTRRPKLLLAAHVDVVPADEKMRTARVEGPRLVGRGAKDMLFAVAGYIWLIDNLRSQLPMLDIALALNGDEEVGGRNSMPHLLEEGWRPEAAWLPDAGNNLHELVVRAKGVYNFDITAHGRSHHGSQPWEGDNAAHKLLRLLREVEDEFGTPSPDRSTCSINGLRAGEAENQGPATATAHLDIRYTDKAELDRYKLWLSDMCRRYNAEMSGLLHIPAFSVDIESPAVRKYIAINEAMTKSKIQLAHANSASDARYFGELGIPVIMASPLGGSLHSNEEWIDLDALVEYCHVMKEYVLKTARIK